MLTTQTPTPKEPEFHDVFHSVPSPSTIETISLHGKYLISPLFDALTPSLQKEKEGKELPKEWPLRYKLAARTVRNIMDKISEFDQPNPKYFQSITETPNPLPFKALLKTDSNFTVDEEVIKFMKNHTNEQWPSVADEQPEIYGEWVDAKKGKVDQTRVIYQLHGGAYVLGSAQLYRRMAYFFSKASNAKCYSINYRLAPLYPYPCAVIDAVSGYIHLLKKYKPENIILAGDSAGGGLCLSTLLVLRDMGIPLPSGSYLMSPWVDLTMSQPSFSAFQGTDILPNLPTDSRMGTRIHYYAGNKDLKLGYVSPLFADLQGLCPLFAQVGTVEKLVDEVRLLVGKVKGDVVLEEYKSHVHVFQQLRPVSEGAKVSVDRAGVWMREVFEGRKERKERKRRVYELDFLGNELGFKDININQS